MTRSETAHNYGLPVVSRVTNTTCAVTAPADASPSGLKMVQMAIFIPYCRCINSASAMTTAPATMR